MSPLAHLGLDLRGVDPAVVKLRGLSLAVQKQLRNTLWKQKTILMCYQFWNVCEAIRRPATREAFDEAVIKKLQLADLMNEDPGTPEERLQKAIDWMNNNAELVNKTEASVTER